MLTFCVPNKGYPSNASCTLNYIFTFVLSSLGRCLNWMRNTLGEYHPESGQCFGTDMVFKIYILLNFTLLNIVIIIKTNAHLSSISNFNFRRCMLSCLGPRGVLGPMEFKIIWILTVRLPDKYFFQKRVLCNKKSLNLPKG
jgi:hypothetical protein